LCAHPARGRPAGRRPRAAPPGPARAPRRTPAGSRDGAPTRLPVGPCCRPASQRRPRGRTGRPPHGRARETRRRVSPETERRHASWVLRLLVDASIAARAPDPLDWDLLLDLTRANGVLVRTAERLATLGVQIPERFAAAVASERERVRSTLALVRQLSRACEAHGIEDVFPKLFQDYPDRGDGVDLLLPEPS